MQELTSLSIEQLHALISAVQAEISSRSNAVQPLRVTKTFGSYNQRRYGRPWIARVIAWPVGGRVELQFGAYLGDARDGAGGEAEIMARPGDIVRWGQKDNRGGNTEAAWGVVEADASIRTIEQDEASKLFRQVKA